MRTLNLVLVGLLVSGINLSIGQTIDPLFKPKFLEFARINKTLPLPDGTTVVLGDFDYYNGLPNRYIVKIKTDGALDASFNSGIGPNNTVYDALLLQDGKLLISGAFTTYNGADKKGLAILNANGSLDNTFTASGLDTDAIILSAAVQSDNKIVVLQHKGSGFPSSQYTQVVRLNSDGTKDNSFAVSSTKTGQSIQSILLLPDGKIIIGGWFKDLNDIPGASSMIRLNTDGSHDASFNAGFDGELSSAVRKIVRLDDGKFYITGNLSLRRILANGGNDNTFSTTNPYTPNNICLLSNQSIVFVQSGTVRKLDATGAVVATYNVGNYADQAFSLPGDRIFTGVNVLNDQKSHIALNADLSVDGGWQKTLALDDYYFNNIVEGKPKFFKQHNGKWMVQTIADYYTRGELSQLFPCNWLFRLNNDLTFDGDFSFVSSDPNSNAKFLYSNAEGIYVNSSSDNVIALRKLKPDGSVDASFAPVPGNFNALDEQANGQLVAVEWGSSGSTGKIVRINTNGSIDNSLNVISEDQMMTIDVQTDGKYIISIKAWDASNGITVNGTAVREVFRLNSNGSFDDTFHLSSSTSISTNNRLTVLSDNKIIAAGVISQPATGLFPIASWDINGASIFPTINSLQNKRGLDFTLNENFIYLLTRQINDFELIRLLSNGELDPYFKPLKYHTTSSNFQSSEPDRVHLLQDGSLLVLGWTDIYHVVLPIAAPTAPTNLSAAAENLMLEINLTWTDNSSDEIGFEIERSENGSAYLKIAVTEPNVTTFKDTNLSFTTQYEYRVRGVNAKGAGAYSNSASILSITDVEESQSSFEVFPNPANNLITVQVSQFSNNGLIRIYKPDGTKMMMMEFEGGTTQIDISALSSGLYFLQMDFGAEKKFFKLLKQ